MHGIKNVLFILSDQHNASFMSGQGAQTPSLDALASQGARFDAAYCQNPLCVPSRASILTGKHCKSTGVYDNRHIIEPYSLTIPRIFAQNGYDTCVIGKTHFNGEQFHGYQSRPYGDIFGQAHQPDPERDDTESGLGPLIAGAGPSGIPLALTQTEICAAESVKYLQARASDGRPFFLSVNFDKPHFPINPPARFYEKYAHRVSLPEYSPDIYSRSVRFVREAIFSNGAYEHYGTDEEIHLRALAAYCGCIEWVDDAAGRILDALFYLGLEKDTIIVYASDHGEMAGRRGAWQKSLFFDDSARVPLIIKADGMRGVISKPVCLIDLFPTLCELAKLPVPEGCEGISLASAENTEKREYIFCESSVYKKPEHAGCMVRSTRYKYNAYLDGDDELYDMINDPSELENLINSPEHSKTAKNMKKEADSFFKPDLFAQRFAKTPMMLRDKHHYEFSNQFMSSDGRIFDARP